MAKKDPTESISQHFGELHDPRIDRQKRHLLHDILVIAICAIICGAEDWVAIEKFGKAKLAWFGTFLALPNGIPSHDTFGRVFAALGPKTFSKCFAQWIQAVAKVTDGDVVAIDGKTLRRSFDRASNRAAIHMVSAWSKANGLVLGQVKTAAKSNEITAIPRLLQILDVTGCLVTIDAMGCQKAIAGKIIDSNGDYLLAVKENQETLHRDVTAHFKRIKDTAAEPRDTAFEYFEESGKEHGREERRQVWCTSDTSGLSTREDWRELNCIAMVIATRTLNDKVETQQRYYISSLLGDNAERIGKAARAHWGIENSVHWVLDVAFQEDSCRVRKDNAPQNLSILRHIALNLLKNEKTAKVGVKNKRLLAGWDESYLLKILGV